MKLCVSKSMTAMLIFAVISFSCASTKQTSIEPINSNQEAAAASSKKEPNESDSYKAKASSAKLTLLSSPKQTTKGKIFTSPYILQALDSEGKPVEAFEISVVYPSSREDGKVVFAETAMLTDSEGKASFLPSAPEHSFNSEVSFFPRGNMENAEIAKIAEEYTVKAPYQVQTNLKSAGGVIAIVDFNPNGKVITSNPISSTNVLMSLMKLGFTRIGNIDLTNQVIAENDAKTLEKTKALVGNGSSFLIFGTVKIEAYEKADSSSTYTVSGDIKCMDLKTGAITFVSKESVSVTDKNDWLALDNARKELAKKIADEIKYGI